MTSPGKRKYFCIFALHSVALAMTALAELIYAGVDPNQMKYKWFGCPDVVSGAVDGDTSSWRCG